MNSSTKRNKKLNSFEKSPIQHEIPIIRDFYNKNRTSLYECTPLNKKTILKFMQTPSNRNLLLQR